jgi:hypothetical protein
MATNKYVNGVAMNIPLSFPALVRTRSVAHGMAKSVVRESIKQRIFWSIGWLMGYGDTLDPDRVERIVSFCR